MQVALPGITFTGGTISLAMNTTTAATLGLPAGPFLRVSGDGVSLNILGQSISASFTFEQTTDGSGAKVVKIGISNGEIHLGNNVVNVTNIHGLVVITSTGLGASLSASVSIGVSGLSIAGALELDLNTTTAVMHEAVDVGGASVTLAGNLALKVNSTGARVQQTFNVGGVTKTLDVAACTPTCTLLEVTGTGVTLTVAGQTLSGDITVEKAAGSLTVGIAHGEITLGTAASPLVRVTDINTTTPFTLTSAGIVGTVSGTVVVDVPGVKFSSSMTLSIDTTSSPKVVELESTTTTLTVAGQTIGGSFVVRRQTIGAETDISIAVADLTLNLGNGVVHVLPAHHWSGALVVSQLGVAATFSG
ncbi:MAG TPA: hypothetical protein VKJ07_01510, partial [Mycobacteriales bacterium]|nr:hypothetical protein [Mycobacteriales bacterium]